MELSKFVADHDFCLEIKYEEQHQPHVIIEKGDTDKGVHTRTHTHTHTHTPFNGPLSGTTLMSWYQKGKTNLDLTEAKRR